MFATILLLSLAAAPHGEEDLLAGPADGLFVGTDWAGGDNGRLQKINAAAGQRSLIESALAAEEVAPSLAAQWLERVHTDADWLRTSSEDASPAEQAARIYHLLHQRYLIGSYQADCPGLAATLRGESFNCLTATLLFHALSDRCDLIVCIQATPTHIFSRVEGVGAVHADARRWQAADDRGRTLSADQVLGKVVYNRGLSLADAGDFPEATRCFSRAWQLDADHEPSRANLLAVINNWALQLNSHRRYARAVALIEQGLALQPGHEALLANDLHVHRTWIEALCRQRRFHQAQQVLERARRRRPDVPLFDRAAEVVAELADQPR